MTNKTVTLDAGDTLIVVDGDTHHKDVVCVISIFENDLTLESTGCYELKHTESLSQFAKENID